MPRSAQEDPLKSFRFRIVVDGFIRAAFKECTGLSSDTDVAEYREGGMNETPQKSAGLTKFGNVTLKRGQIVQSSRGGDDDFYTWYQQVFSAAVQGNAPNYRKDLTIQQFSATNALVRSWTLSNCWPKTFKPFGDLKADASENLVEELEIVHEGFELAKATA